MADTGLLGINPYYKGNVLDVSKPVNLAIQMKQREDAKKEALDKYFMDYEKSLNPAGMRQQDQDVFLKKLAENKQYYLQNRDRILNPSRYGAEYQSEYMSRFKNILSDIDKSKQLAANGKVIQRALTDARNRNQQVPQQVVDNIYNNQLSIGDPNHVDFDPSVDFDAYDKHDPVKYQQGIYSKIKQSESMPEMIKDKVNHTIAYKTVNDIDKSSLPDIQNLVSGELRKDRGLIDQLKEIGQDPAKLNQLGQVYQNFTGKPMDPNSLLDVGTAYTIALKPAPVVKYTTPTEDAAFRRYQSIVDSMTLMNMKDNEKLNDIANAHANTLTDLVNQSAKSPKTIYNQDTKRNETWYVVPLPKSVQSQFTSPIELPVKNTRGEKVGQKVVQKEVDNVLYNPRKKEWIGYYQNLDDEGNPTKKFDQKILNPRDVAKFLLKGVTTPKEAEVAIGSALKGLYSEPKVESKTTKFKGVPRDLF
jgi:hypothetical protein